MLKAYALSTDAQISLESSLILELVQTPDSSMWGL